MAVIRESPVSYMENNYNALHRAIQKKNWKELERMIRSGFEDDFDQCHYNNWPLIFSIIEAGRESLALLWLEHGYPSFAYSGKKVGILHWAAKYGMPRLVKKMLEGGFDANKQTEDFRSPLWYAASGGNLECAKILLDAGANVDGLELDDDPAWQPRLDTPLCEAANAKMAKFLLESGASLDIRPYGSEFVWGEGAEFFNMEDELLSPLTVAAMRGRMDVVRLFAGLGLPLDSQPLRFMAFGKCEAKLEHAVELIRIGAYPDGEPGKEPLRVAARAGNEAFCRILLEAGAKLLPDVLNLAVLSGKERCVNLFLDACDLGDATHLAAKRYDLAMLDKFLDLRSGLADHALLGAIEGCHLQLAEYLLTKCVSPCFRDKDGKTALAVLYSIDRRTDAYLFMKFNPKRYPGEWQFRDRWCPSERLLRKCEPFDFYIHRPDNWDKILNQVENDVMALAERLIKLGGDINAADNMGRSVIWHACSMGWLKSIPWLAEMGADINARDKDGKSAFDAGCLCGESLTIEPMLKAGAIINAQDVNGDTALIKCGRKTIEEPDGWAFSAVNELLRFGADPDIENNNGESLRRLAEKDRILQNSLDCFEKK